MNRCLIFILPDQEGAGQHWKIHGAPEPDKTGRLNWEHDGKYKVVKITKKIFNASWLVTSNNNGIRTHEMMIYHVSIDDSSTGSGEVRATCVPRTIGWRENLFRFSSVILKGSLPFLPRLCQFSESTLLDLWPHLKYSMHPSSIFNGIPESLYYCL